MSGTLGIKKLDVSEAMEDLFMESGGSLVVFRWTMHRYLLKIRRFRNLRRSEGFFGFWVSIGLILCVPVLDTRGVRGEIERSFSYLEDHFIRNREFDSFEDFYEQLSYLTLIGIAGFMLLQTGRLWSFWAGEFEALELARDSSSGQVLRYVSSQGDPGG